MLSRHSDDRREEESGQGSVIGAIRHADPVGGSIQSILLLDSS